MKDKNHTLNVTIVTIKVIMLEISLGRTMVHATTLEATIACLIIKAKEMIEGMIVMEEMEEMKEEEGILQVIMNKTIVLKTSQETLGMKLML